jgi:hypothetical protein
VVYPHTLCHQSLQLLKRKGRRPPLQKKELKIAVGLLWNLLRKLVSLCNWWMTTFFFLSTDMHPQSHKWLQWVIPFRSAGADDGKFWKTTMVIRYSK